MNVVVDGLMTNYQKTGSGKKVIVCLPGWADALESFSSLSEILKTDYTILSLDLPGFGGTQAPPQAWSLEDYAEFVAGWLEKLKISRAHAVIGHSYGGAVAITALGNRFIDSDKLILLASAGIRGKKTFQKKALAAIARAGKVPLYALPKARREKIRSSLYKKIGSDLTLLPHMEETFKLIIGHDVRGVAKLVNTPTLLIYGDLDKDTPISDGELLQNSIAGSRFEIINKAGHFLHQTNTREVGSLIKIFLEAK